MKKVLAALAVSVLLAACTAPQTKGLRTVLPADAKPVDIAGVPFFPQEDYQCGPAALATLLDYTGLKTTPADLVDQVYVPGRKGSFGIEMAAAARKQGRLVYSLAPHLGALLTALEQGYPVLVLQNNGLGIYPVWHYAVVVAADRHAEKLWLRSGRTERLEMTFSTFERTWKRADYWGVLILDPAKVPDTLEPRVVVRELALMESLGAVKEAQAGFSRALLNWPEQKTAWLGLASSSQALGENDRAESVLRELVRREPNYGAGLNNLADLLLKSGRAQEALPYAERAVSYLDIPQSRATLSAVRQALLAPPPAVAIPLRRPAPAAAKAEEPVTP